MACWSFAIVTMGLRGWSYGKHGIHAHWSASAFGRTTIQPEGRRMVELVAQDNGLWHRSRSRFVRYTGWWSSTTGVLLAARSETRAGTPAGNGTQAGPRALCW